MSPRTGRPPIENPKSDRVTIRLTEYEMKILDEYAKKYRAKKTDALRRGLSLMEVATKNNYARQMFDAIVVLQDLIDRDSNLVNEQIGQVRENFKWYMDSLK